MATWAIGDVQGCYEPLRRLVDEAAIALDRDRLWFVGDLVNRGPQSADVLRWVKGLGDTATVVLGNHDLHLIEMALGLREPKARDTAQEVLAEPDGEALVHWLRWRSLVHVEGENLMVHAGLLPSWRWRTAVQLGREIEPVLRGPLATELLRRDAVAPWSDDLSGMTRWRSALAVLTRIRCVTVPDERMVDYAGPPAGAPGGAVPWFDAPGRQSVDRRIVFGHWAALGVLARDDVVCTDSGCVWGRALTAIRLDDGHAVSVPAQPAT